MRCCVLALCALLAVAALDAAERGFVPLRRTEGAYVALVIGNADYPEAALANPVHDASDVAEALHGIGFDVIRLLDADKEGMAIAIARFGERIMKAKAAVFFYAGHGVQSGGENWLLPIGRTPSTQITEEGQVPLRAIAAGEVLAQMERARVPMNLIILDACRNNPFRSSGRGRVQGLAELNAPVGSLVMYSTSAGKVAADGTGRNSPFTTAFLRHLLTPGLDVRLMVTEINATVGELTGGQQVPWTSMSLRQGFTFVPALSPEEEREAKRAELSGLQAEAGAIATAEAAADAKRKIEEADLARQQAEVDRLDAQIEELKSKLRSGGGAVAGDEGALKRMLEVIHGKEEQQRQLAAMQARAETARREREAELRRMKEMEEHDVSVRERKRLADLAGDLKDYREIAASAFGKDMAQAAWDAVLQKWGLHAGELPRDDVAGLEARVAPHAVAERTAASAAVEEAARLAFAAGTRQALEDFIDRHPGHPRVVEARRRLAQIPRWSAGIGHDAVGVHARVLLGGHEQVLRYVPEGSFRMGSERGLRDELPVREIAITRPFWLADSEVTQALWQAVMGGNPSGFPDDPLCPVEQVSWDDCQEFLARLNRRIPGLDATLPSEAQWEYACRAGTQGDFAGDLERMAWYEANAERRTHPVRTKAANAWGLHDMHGNVWEWCADRYGPYAPGDVRDPSGPASGGSDRVMRGGGWLYAAAYCRSALRSYGAPGDRHHRLGFRFAAPVAP
ncbi:MAG: SUMF1/EgtB/PvdO family nonheme iron enzyme [Planctomycetes bacterium]|nr:SUMF1/EgtB/PvdO family nonheme iron enzyme [Planctomycetota bacterium]